MHARHFSLVGLLVIATTLSVFPAMAEEEHTEHLAGGDHHGAGGHEVRIYGVSFEVMFCTVR